MKDQSVPATEENENVAAPSGAADKPYRKKSKGKVAAMIIIAVIVLAGMAALAFLYFRGNDSFRKDDSTAGLEAVMQDDTESPENVMDTGNASEDGTVTGGTEIEADMDDNGNEIAEAENRQGEMAKPAKPGTVVSGKVTDTKTETGNGGTGGENSIDHGAETDNIDDSENTYGTDMYLLPDSDSKYLSKKDLENFTADQCRIARNEIYARHGRKFKDDELQKYFDSQPWYRGTIAPDDFSESMLNEFEIANRDLIVAFEKQKGYR